MTSNGRQHHPPKRLTEDLLLLICLYGEERLCPDFTTQPYPHQSVNGVKYHAYLIGQLMIHERYESSCLADYLSVICNAPSLLHPPSTITVVAKLPSNQWDNKSKSRVPILDWHHRYSSFPCHQCLASYLLYLPLYLIQCCPVHSRTASSLWIISLQTLCDCFIVILHQSFQILGNQPPLHKTHAVTVSFHNQSAIITFILSSCNSCYTWLHTYMDKA